LDIEVRIVLGISRISGHDNDGRVGGIHTDAGVNSLDPYVISRVSSQICDSLRSLGDGDDIDGGASLKLIVESILIERETSRIVP